MKINSCKMYLYLILIFAMSSFVYSANICNINFDSGGADFKTSTGSSVFYLDGDGDMLLVGKKSSSTDSNSLKWFDDTNSVNLGITNAKFSHFYENSATTSGDGFLFRDSSSNTLAFIGKNGDIYSKGRILFDLRGKGDTDNNMCNNDGKFYCGSSNRVGSTFILAETPTNINRGYAETRDYFCDIDSINSGNCKYDVSASENCNTFTDYYGCVGNNKYLYFPGCSGGSCTIFNSFVTNCGSDTCVDLRYESYSCSPHDCNCITTGTPPDTTTTCDTCYNTCWSWNCYKMNYRGCSGGACYSYFG